LLLTIICTPFSSPLCEVAFDNFFIKEFYDDDDDDDQCIGGLNNYYSMQLPWFAG